MAPRPQITGRRQFPLVVDHMLPRRAGQLMPSTIRGALAWWGVPGLTCRPGAMHTVRSARLDISVARLSEMIELSRHVDDEMRYWNGWREQDAAWELIEAEPHVPVWTREFASFVGRERGTGKPVVSISLSLHSDRQIHVGGWVVRGFRNQGYGREALDMVCAIAHRHLGLVHVTAGCETSNVASQRWLASCGFVRVDGPPTHVLPNGRVIDSDWWRHSDHRSRRRCRSLHAPGLMIHFG